MYLYIYPTLIKSSIHKQTCSNALNVGNDIIVRLECLHNVHGRFNSTSLFSCINLHLATSVDFEMHSACSQFICPIISIQLNMPKSNDSSVCFATHL